LVLKCGFRFLGRGGEHAEQNPRFLEFGPPNLDFLEQGEKFTDTTFPIQIHDSCNAQLFSVLPENPENGSKDSKGATFALLNSQLKMSSASLAMRPSKKYGPKRKYTDTVSRFQDSSFGC
jgi:hypothetical protein